MDFRGKLKQRLFIAIIFATLGIVMIAGAFVAKTDNDFISSFGLGLVVIGIARIRNYFLITKNEETIKKQKIAETDERNLSIINRARSAAFTLYCLLSCMAIIILSLFNKNEEAKIIAYSVLLLMGIYLISYWIISKKS